MKIRFGFSKKAMGFRHFTTVNIRGGRWQYKDFDFVTKNELTNQVYKNTGLSELVSKEIYTNDFSLAPFRQKQMHIKSKIIGIDFCHHSGILLFI